MKIFTVIANRWGDNENHSYFVGAYDDVVRAYRAAIAEEYWRGGKYECVVHESKLNEHDTKKEEWCEKECMPAGRYTSDVMARVKQHNDLQR